MTDNAQSRGERDVFGRIAAVELVAMGIRRGSPEHAEFIATRLGLPPQPPPPQSELQPTAQLSRASVQARDSAPSLDRHERKCVVCSHPDRAEIEELFLHWHNPWGIATCYKVPARSLYRHAHATGLYAARQGNLRSVLDLLLERAEDCTASGDCVIRAVRAYSCLGGDNRWTESPTRVIYSSQPLLASANAAAPLEVTPKRKRLTPSTRRRRRKNRAPHSRRLIDTKAIRI